MCRLKDARKGHLQPAAIQSSLQGVTEYAGGINMTSGYIQVVVMFGSIFFVHWSANNFTKNIAFCRYIINWSPILPPYPFQSETCANTQDKNPSIFSYLCGT